MERCGAVQEPARVCKGVVADMRESDIAHAKSVVLAKHGEGIAKLVGAKIGRKIQQR